ncbi:MAG: carotenoid oxygenase family protein [Pseudomonadota bacterium]|nr:carotenoid oxygenase family protein [Pseudomonadota bacterium]
MNSKLSMNRRDAVRAFGALGAVAALPSFAAASGASPLATDGAAFDAAVADMPWLAPFKGVDDADPARTDLRCESLAVTGRWPAGLRGRFYRNGPALFERNGQRYHHWFDGDGMVQQFTFSGRGVSHVGRLVRTPKLAAEREAGRFLYSAFGTGIQSEAPIQGPDSMNVANTNAIEHAGKVLAMWEGGSAFALDPKDLSTIGPVTWKEGFEQVPFSAHPKLDSTGNLWNIGTFGGKIVVWHVDAAGQLARVQVGESPYPNGMAHDVAVTPQYIVLPLPPIKMNYAAIAKGATPEQAFDFQKSEPLRILVMKKDDIRERRIFELQAQMVFHVGNAYERPDGSIALTFVGAQNDEFLIHGAVAMVAGHVAGPTGSQMQSAVLDMKSGRASVEALPGVVEFPRIDPRRIGTAARYVATASSWKNYGARKGALFHGVQLRDLQTGRVDRFDYGGRMVVEEHIVVPKPRGTNELDAWLVGTTFDAQRKVSIVNVLDARHVADGPIAQAALPYWLPLGFHGNFSAA